MLKIDHLQKQYGNFSLDCSLEVKAGCITGLIGQNGAGKSTTFKSVLGLIAKDSGTISLLGKEIETFSARDRENLGVVLSDSGFSGYLTPRDYLPVLKQMYHNFQEDYWKEQLQKLKLPLDKKIKDFSTGMKAKFKVLTALSHQAKLLILDEPTAGLDVVARDEILEMLRNYMEAEEERAILISSHISSDLETLCDDIYMIHNGQMILHEDTDILLADYALLKVSKQQYQELDSRYLLKVKKEPFGFSCLTNQKQYFRENYPQIVMENGSIDKIIIMMIGGTDE
ncbi:MAG: ABC transporter ATP-binding protein [Bacillota bacterium]|nr:ABC transporter ATP-binding protein [Bacillota bacterium]